jgi:hypothetical protein
VSHTTKRRLNKFADVLEAVATNIINAIELVVMDAAGAKRSRRVRAPRSYVRRSVYRQAPQELIIKVVQGKEQ